MPREWSFNPLHLGEGPATATSTNSRLTCAARFNPLHLGEGPATRTHRTVSIAERKRFNPLHLGEGPATSVMAILRRRRKAVFQSPSSRGRSCDQSQEVRYERHGKFQSPSSRGRSCDRAAFQGPHGRHDPRFNPLHLGEGPATSVIAIHRILAGDELFQSPSSRGRSCDESRAQQPPVQRHLVSIPFISGKVLRHYWTLGSCAQLIEFQSPSSRGRSCDAARPWSARRPSRRRFNPLHLGEGPATARGARVRSVRARHGFNPLHLGEGPATHHLAGPCSVRVSGARYDAPPSLVWWMCFVHIPSFSQDLVKSSFSSPMHPPACHPVTSGVDSPVFQRS